MAQVFANKSTLSVGKIETEFLSDEYIRPIMKRLHSRQGRFIVALLVGCVDGLTRHLVRMNKLGVSEQDIVIFERDYATFRRLRRAIIKRRLKCRIFHSCLLAGVKQLSQKESFSYIEFDGVCQYGTFEFDLYKLVKQLDIPVLICQGSSRGQVEQVKETAKRLKMRRKRNMGYLCFNLIPVAKRIISRKLRGYQSEIFTYRGVSNMYMQISIQNGVSI